MNSFDVINPNEVSEDKLPNGSEIIRHEENAFANHYKSGKSFDELEDVKVDEKTDAGVHFAFDFKLHPDGVKKLVAVGNQIQSNSCVLQHRLVMFSYAYSVSVVGEDKESGLVCQFSLIPINHTFRYPLGVTKGGVASTFKVDAPELRDPKLVIVGVSTLDLKRERGGAYGCEMNIFLESLRVLTENGIATLRVEMTIDDDFFDLGQYVDLNLQQAHVAPNSDAVLQKILAGESVPKSDWVITVGEGSPRDFHVHGAVLANASISMKAAISSHMGIGDMLAMVSHENRFILPKLASTDMKVLLTFIYQRRYVMPEFDAVHRIGYTLTMLFRDQIPNFFKYWEAEIILKMKELDRTKTVSTLAECVKALLIVHTAPKGALLAAYNSALIVAADTWQITEAKGKKVKVEKVKKEIGKDWENIDYILELIDDFKGSVCGVEKSNYIH